MARKPKTEAEPVAQEAPKPQARETMIDVQSAARLLMISDERVRQLAKQGYIPKGAKNTYPLVGSVQGYIRFLKEDERRSSRVQSESRVRDARAREIELKIAALERRLIAMSEARSAIAAICGMVNAALGSLPSKVTRDIELRRSLEKQINVIKSDLCKVLDERVGALRTGASVTVSDDEDGT